MSDPRSLLPEAPFSELTPLASRGGVQPRYAEPWGSRVWNAVLSYFPVLLMGLLAALTWWLVKNTPVPGEDDGQRAVRHEPDYTMEAFSVVGYGAGGQQTSRLEGKLLRHYPDTETIEIDELRVRVVDPEGRVMVGSADRGLSNRDGSQVRMMGNARVLREPGPKESAEDRMEIRGEFLELLTQGERVKSHLPVTMITPRGEMRAGNLDYGHLDRSGQFGGRVRGELRPVPRPTP